MFIKFNLNSLKRIIIYSIVLFLIIITIFIYINNKRFYGLTLGDFAKIDTSLLAKEKELEQTVVKIETSTGSGTGVIIFSDELFIYILTNAHVVDGLDINSEVRFIGNLKDICVKSPLLLGYDEFVDIALICVPKCVSNFKIAEVETVTPKKGDKLFTIGHPIGLINFYSMGVYGTNINSSTFCSDITVAPGASGSPVFNENGKLVGLVSAFYLEPMPKNNYWHSFFTKGTNLALINYTICINLKAITHFIEELNIHGQK